MEDKVDVEKLALLARIKLNAGEKEKLQGEFEAVLGYISKLEEVDVSGIGERDAARTVEIENVMREDEPSREPGEFSDDLLDAAPAVEKGFVKVKRVLS